MLISHFKNYWFAWLTIVGILALGVFVFLKAYSRIMWVGGADIAISFEITDAVTGKPIPNAEINIEVRTPGFCRDDGQKEFTLTTGADGIAHKLAEKCMCFGDADFFLERLGHSCSQLEVYCFSQGFHYVRGNPYQSFSPSGNSTVSENPLTSEFRLS